MNEVCHPTASFKDWSEQVSPSWACPQKSLESLFEAPNAPFYCYPNSSVSFVESSNDWVGRISFTVVNPTKNEHVSTHITWVTEEVLSNSISIIVLEIF